MAELSPEQWEILRSIVRQPLEAFQLTTPSSPLSSQEYKTTLSKLKLQTERQLSDTLAPYQHTLRRVVQVLNTTVPPPIQPSVKRYIQFYCHYLDPYLVGVDSAVASQDQRVRMLKGEIQTVYLNSVRSEWKSTSVLVQRHNAGLLRDGQVGLLVIAERALEDTVKAIIAVDLEGASEMGRVYQLMKVYVAIKSYQVLLRKLLLSRRFRSEALERKMLRYLAEDDVNQELVGKLEKINWYYQLNSSLFLQKEILPDSANKDFDR
ncbi:hypothetical protein BJ508DRAFT_376978 [Ascobolus immersus RN42]|uniref:Uncharacterized protein n=1 Tax=Ascobolus immersus RN42 TaxID=1160509 RepID=A0A3N4I7D8_ASCIM|nr:hypothetical protein BJ508DRAFT_376978 [Ascobolus immersus RN42]